MPLIEDVAVEELTRDALPCDGKLFHTARRYRHQGSTIGLRPKQRHRPKRRNHRREYAKHVGGRRALRQSGLGRFAFAHFN